MKKYQAHSKKYYILISVGLFILFMWGNEILGVVVEVIGKDNAVVILSICMIWLAGSMFFASRFKVDTLEGKVKELSTNVINDKYNNDTDEIGKDSAINDLRCELDDLKEQIKELKEKNNELVTRIDSMKT